MALSSSNDSLLAVLPGTWRAASLLTVALVVIYTLKKVYRLTLHPLAKVPGPPLAKITGWYPTISCATGRRHLNQYECHQKYGSIVRWAPDYVIFDSISAIQTIYGDSRRNNIRKDDLYSFFDDPKDKQSTITTSDKNLQARKRRILSHAFSPQALQGSDEILFHVSQSWCEAIAKEVPGNQWSKALDLSAYSDWYTMDAAAMLTFNKSFNLIGSPEFRFLPSWITNSFHLLNFVGHSPLLPYWPFLKRLRLNYLLDYDGWSRRPKFMAIVNGLMVERTQLETDDSEAHRRDFYHFIRTATDTETKEPYSLPEVLTECAMLMNGGTGGPSTMLTGCFFYLTAYPKVLEKLTNELHTRFRSKESIKAGPELNSCTYLQAVLEESVRLSTAHAGTLPRRVMQGGQVIDGIFIPPGTTVGVAAYAVHHNPDYFPRPFEFWPERWIVGSSPEVTHDTVTRAKKALFSFSAGGNNCIGKPTAYRMIGLALATIVWNFIIRREHGNLTNTKELPFVDMFSAKPAKVKIEFKKRLK